MSQIAFHTTSESIKSQLLTRLIRYPHAAPRSSSHSSGWEVRRQTTRLPQGSARADGKIKNMAFSPYSPLCFNSKPGPRTHTRLEKTFGSHLFESFSKFCMTHFQNLEKQFVIILQFLNSSAEIITNKTLTSIPLSPIYKQYYMYQLDFKKKRQNCAALFRMEWSQFLGQKQN